MDFYHQVIQLGSYLKIIGSESESSPFYHTPHNLPFF